ncbi:MAG: TrkA family potassium uptake protein [Desulfobulbaceae bacterium]|nr:TrkA family potassium uptake protein [Desulfobulbaceae bacterium]
MDRTLQAGVIGLGKFGYKFGKTLMELGHTVVGIDNNPDNIKLSQHVFTQVFQADATDKTALAQIGVGDLSHVLVSVGDSIAASAMISMYLKELGVEVVWVKAINSDHEKLLRKIGVDEVVRPEHLAAKQLANRMAIPGFIELLPFDKTMAIKELMITEWAGKSLRELDITNRFNIQVIATRKARATMFKFIPKADERLESGDVLVVIGHIEELNSLES